MTGQYCPPPRHSSVNKTKHEQACGGAVLSAHADICALVTVAFRSPARSPHEYRCAPAARLPLQGRAAPFQIASSGDARAQGCVSGTEPGRSLSVVLGNDRTKPRYAGRRSAVGTRVALAIQIAGDGAHRQARRLRDFLPRLPRLAQAGRGLCSRGA